MFRREEAHGNWRSYNGKVERKRVTARAIAARIKKVRAPRKVEGIDEQPRSARSKGFPFRARASEQTKQYNIANYILNPSAN